MPSRLPTLAACALIVVAGLAAFWPGLHGGFLFDDYPNLVLDEDWKVVEGTAAEWQRAMSHGISSSAGRPLAMLSFGVNHYFTGLDPWAMKLTGVAWHLLNGILVFFLIRSLLQVTAAQGYTSIPPGPTNRSAEAIAALVAIAWTIHPLQVSSALYIIQRMEVGAYTFVILSLLAYIKARSCQLSGRSGAPWWVATIALPFVGFGFKESALLAPAYALVAELCCFRFAAATPRQTRLLTAAWIALCVAGASLFLGWILPAALAPEAYAIRDFTLGQRLMTQLPVLSMYLGQILLPIPQHLVFYYDHLPISSGLLAPPSTALGACILTALVVIAGLSWRKRPLVSIGIGWFLVGHGLTSNVIPLELAFEHRNYFALLGILIALIEPVRLLGRIFTDSRIAWFAAGLPLILLFALTLILAHSWGDPMRLAVMLASKNPGSTRASYLLGGELFKQAGTPDSPAWSMAYREFENAAELSRSSPLPSHALMIMDARAGREISLARWEHLRGLLRNRGQMGPDEIQALFGLVNCRINGGCEFDDQQLANTLTAALASDPENPTLHTIYGNFAWNVMQDQTLALSMAEEAIRLEPGNTVNQVNLLRFLLAPDLHEDLRRRSEATDLIRRIQAQNADGRWTRVLNEIQSGTEAANSVEPQLSGPTQHGQHNPGE